MLSLLDTAPGTGVSPKPDQLQRQFAYDALYRLVSATGREVDLPVTLPPWLENTARFDTTQVRGYTETYGYDEVDNLTGLGHSATAPDGNYTRSFALTPASNQLRQVTVLGNSYDYSYDACGNLLTETTSRLFEWDHADRLTTYRTQAAATAEPSVYVQYRYDAAGQRVLKVTRNQGGDLNVAVYIDDLFERLSLTSAGTTTAYDTLLVNDNNSSVALVRAGSPAPGDTTPATLYQLGDHLGSSEIVLDTVGEFVKREEFLPYGETSYGGYARKRYRFTGKERDEESGLYYAGARHYASWLARWTSCDPTGLSGGLSLYAYVQGNPLRFVDPSGTQEMSPVPTGAGPPPPLLWDGPPADPAPMPPANPPTVPPEIPPEAAAGGEELAPVVESLAPAAAPAATVTGVLLGIGAWFYSIISSVGAANQRGIAAREEAEAEYADPPEQRAPVKDPGRPVLMMDPIDVEKAVREPERTPVGDAKDSTEIREPEPEQPQLEAAKKGPQEHHYLTPKSKQFGPFFADQSHPLAGTSNRSGTRRCFLTKADTRTCTTCSLDLAYSRHSRKPGPRKSSSRHSNST